MDAVVVIVIAASGVIWIRRCHGQGWTGHYGGDVAFHGLLVEAIEAEAGGGWWARGTCSGEAADCC